jgi:hypothetical protein
LFLVKSPLTLIKPLLSLKRDDKGDQTQGKQKGCCPTSYNGGELCGVQFLLHTLSITHIYPFEIENLVRPWFRGVLCMDVKREQEKTSPASAATDLLRPYVVNEQFG